ncbi:FAD/NAD(P)-binding protein [Saccharothrix violaceirubra]|uniref:Putative NAD(P)/FAD-binding protein YdhS n=1 Tax=Saccharothrix violaceirubra TaxID=413306 RepID=A0A7W7WY67_9PSEU|nr:FAD/NAD(P)-binding protein [Saccharothrix violaceirubra]MBB4967383.1 putative NAD(P)/FAD-binding protein YdhS [Saccharothrix violaceirubra]
MDHTRSRVVIVGAGAAGVTVAARLAGLPADVSLVDPDPRPGRGVAYSTGHAGHLLNTPAGRMSAFPDEPDHFVRWASRLTGRAVGPGEFLARHHFGTYLGSVLAGCPVRHVRARAVGVRAGAVELADGRALPFDAAVLAVGAFPSSGSWAPPALVADSRFVPNPWSANAFVSVPDDLDVLLVGTGLTAVDVTMLLDRPGRVVHAVSRHGLLPRAHAPSRPVDVPRVEGCSDLDSVRALLVGRVRALGDWRTAVDGLRPVTAGLWQRLSEVDRARFLAEDVRLWDVRRHRMPPAAASWVGRTRAVGRLRVHRGSVVAADLFRRAVHVRLSTGSVLRVGAVVDCTGQHNDPALATDPLIRSLLRTGLIRRDPLGLGIRTAPDGRVLPLDAPLWTIGAPRRGDLWETTAYPEIRAQATTVAESVATHLSTTAYHAA